MNVQSVLLKANSIKFVSLCKLSVCDIGTEVVHVGSAIVNVALSILRFVLFAVQVVNGRNIP